MGCLAASVIGRCVAFGEITKFYWPKRWTERGLRRHLTLDSIHKFDADLVDELTFQDCIDLHDWHHLELRVIRNNPKPAPFPEGHQVPETAEGRGETSRPEGESWEDYFKRRAIEAEDRERELQRMAFVESKVREQLVEVIDQWKLAWSNQDVDGYLASYATDFQTPRGESRQAWEQSRRTRLTRPEYIRIELSYRNFKRIDTGVIEVELRQRYQSNTYSDTCDKILQLKIEDDTWKILKERSN